MRLPAAIVTGGAGRIIVRGPEMCLSLHRNGILGEAKGPAHRANEVHNPLCGDWAMPAPELGLA